MLCLASVLALSVVGCSCSSPREPTEQGVVRFGGDQGVLCFQNRPDASMITGESVEVEPGPAVTLLHLELAGADGVELSDSFTLAQTSPESSVGAARYREDDPRWADRAPVAGVVLQPGQQISLAAVLRRSGASEGRAKGLVLEFSVDGRVQRQENSTSYVLADTCG